MTKGPRAGGVCPVPGCPNLSPCEIHGHSASGNWSRQRPDDREQRRRWRPIVLARDGHRCRWCGATGQLQVHHVRGADAPIRCADDLLALCVDCNRRAG